MSCYFRHLEDLFAEAGLTVTPENRKQVDAAIHELVGMSDADCPAVWKKLKQDILSDPDARADFIQLLKQRI